MTNYERTDVSVAKADRGKSNFEVEDRSRRIRKAIIDFLLRDMGMKANKRNIRNSSIGKYKRHEDGGIDALCQGIHPLTGKPINNLKLTDPEIIRGLFLVRDKL